MEPSHAYSGNRHQRRRECNLGGKQPTVCHRRGGGEGWGYNTFGQLGDATQFQRLVPVDVNGLDGATAITTSVGGDHTCAIVGGASLCWGNNINGQLGDGSNNQR